MNLNPKCPKCGQMMGEGYVLDRSYAAKLVSMWIAGKPERSFWTNLKTGGRPNLEIQTFRCFKCGYLESYAN
jgi:ribosomal protein S27AE